MIDTHCLNTRHLTEEEISLQELLGLIEELNHLEDGLASTTDMG